MKTLRSPSLSYGWLLTAALLFSTANAHAQSARARYTETFLGGSLWQYDYTFHNDSLSGIDLYEVVIDFPTPATATVGSTAAGWTGIPTANFVQFFSNFPGAPLNGGADIPPGDSLSGFTFTIDQQLGDTMFTANFADTNNGNAPLSFNGLTQAASAPEPGPLALLLLGASGLIAVRRTRKNG